jgi:hypothetical protein
LRLSSTDALGLTIAICLSGVLSAAENGVAVSAQTAVDEKREGAFESTTAVSSESKKSEELPSPAAAPKLEDDGTVQVRLVGIKTDVAKRYNWLVPPLPVPPFTSWRKWYKEHEDAVHCALEWRTEKGEWFHGELRSTHFDVNAEQYRVGWGEFPGTAYDAYGVYLKPGRVNRDKDSYGRPIEVTIDEKVDCDYRRVEQEVRSYAAKGSQPGDEGTGGRGKHNVGLGGPAYKPAQNSNTMINYILKKCGVSRKSPDKAVGWDREPDFPYSSDADAPKVDCRP